MAYSAIFDENRTGAINWPQYQEDIMPRTEQKPSTDRQIALYVALGVLGTFALGFFLAMHGGGL